MDNLNICLQFGQFGQVGHICPYMYIYIYIYIYILAILRRSAWYAVGEISVLYYNNGHRSRVRLQRQPRAPVMQRMLERKTSILGVWTCSWDVWTCVLDVYISDLSLRPDDRWDNFYVFFLENQCFVNITGRHKQYVLVDTIFNYIFHFGLQEHVFT